jgi:hypothetical protein
MNRPVRPSAEELSVLLEAPAMGIIFARSACWSGDTKRAEEWLDIFHNLPRCLAQDRFDPIFFRDFDLSRIEASSSGSAAWVIRLREVIDAMAKRAVGSAATDA